MSNTGNNNANVPNKDDQIQPTSYDYASYDTDKDSDITKDSDFDEFDSIPYDDNNYDSDDNNYNSYGTRNIGLDNTNVDNKDVPIQPTNYDYVSYDTSNIDNDKTNVKNKVDPIQPTNYDHDDHKVSDNNQNSDYDAFDSIPYDYNDYDSKTTTTTK